MKHSHNLKQIKSAVQLHANSTTETHAKYTTHKRVFTRKPKNANFIPVAENQKQKMDESMLSIDTMLTIPSANIANTQNSQDLCLTKREKYPQLYTFNSDIILQMKQPNKRQFVSKQKHQYPSLTASPVNQRKYCKLKQPKGRQLFRECSQSLLRINIQSPSTKPKQIEDNDQHVTHTGMKYQPASGTVLKNNLFVKLNHQQQSLLDRAASQKSIAVECCYCQNNKKIVSILNQKYSKLQQQFNSKASKYNQVAEKYEKLKISNKEMSDKIQKLNQYIVSQQSQVVKNRQELTSRIESLKKQILKMSDKLKYYEIQNSMLLRFKNDNQKAMKENAQLKFQNEQLKNSLMNHSISKSSIFVKNKATKVEEAILFSPAVQINSIYYDCEDDNISLTLSQPSTDSV